MKANAKAIALLRRQLAEAERELAWSWQAATTHGHQGITWEFMRADERRVRELRESLSYASGRAVA